MCHSLTSKWTVCFTPAIADPLNHDILDTLGSPHHTLHFIYFDDDIYLNVNYSDCIEQATAAGIKTIVLLLGEFNLPR